MTGAEKEVATSRKALTPPLKWHSCGGKHYLASKIIALMPNHVHYAEHYFGGGAVMLAKNPEGVSEVANDLNMELMRFWTVMKDELLFSRFQRLAEATPFSQDAWRTALANRGLPHKSVEEQVNLAYQFFVLCRQSLAGRMDTFAPLSRTRTRRGMNEQASAWIGAVDGLPAVHARLRRVAVLNDPALETIRTQDGKDTLHYLDPPYLHETRSTTGEYEFEMSDADHKELLESLRGIKGKFLLSGYRSKLYDDYADRSGWRRVDHDLPNNAAAGAEKERKTECVWANFTPESRP